MRLMHNSYSHRLSNNKQLSQKSVNRCFNGEQHYYSHESTSTKTTMTFSIYLPDEALAGRRCPAVLYLSGLTCSADNVTLTKRTFNKNVVSLVLFLSPLIPHRAAVTMLRYQMMSVILWAKEQAIMWMQPKPLGQIISICKAISLMSYTIYYAQSFQ